MNLHKSDFSEEARFQSAGLAPTGPNNFGPTLLIALGLIAAPIGLGVPLALLGLARLRTSQGASAFPLLATALETVHQHLQAWSVR